MQKRRHPNLQASGHEMCTSCELRLLKHTRKAAAAAAFSNSLSLLSSASTTGALSAGYVMQEGSWRENPSQLHQWCRLVFGTESLSRHRVCVCFPLC